MDKEQREQADYCQKLRRDSRKLADKLFRAHKQQLIKSANNVDENRLPTLKIDIMPVMPEHEFIDVAELNAATPRLTAQRSGLPQDVLMPTVGGLIVHYYKLATTGAFDQLYIGANGHFGLRSETMFGGATDTMGFETEGAITRTQSLAKLAHELFERYEYKGPVVIRMELADIKGWHLNDMDDWGGEPHEYLAAVLPQYVVEKQLDKLAPGGGFSTTSTANDLRRDILWQLGVAV